MTSKKKIVLHTGYLGGGGAQRVMVNLLRELDRERFEAYLVLWRKEGVYFHLLPSDVPVIFFPKKSASMMGHHLHNVNQLAKIIADIEPNLLISFLDSANVLALETKLLTRAPCPFLISQRNNLSVSLTKNYPYSTLRRRLKKWFMAWLYPKADHIITPSQGIKEDLVQHFYVPAKKITSIENPVDVALIDQQSQAQVNYPWEKGRHKIIVGVGRLIEQKGFSDLIRAFSQVRARIPSKLVILGEGGRRAQLEALVTSLNLQNDVYMPGFVKNPWGYMRDADLFVLSSHWEGMGGNVILEAMACQTPVIATDCDFGPREIIQHEHNGLLVPVADIERLSQVMCRVLNDPNKRTKLVHFGRQRALDFDSSKICRRYEELFDEYSI